MHIDIIYTDAITDRVNIWECFSCSYTGKRLILLSYEALETGCYGLIKCQEKQLQFFVSVYNNHVLYL